MAASPELTTAWKALAAKRAAYDRLFAYYDGDQETAYTVKRLAELFRDFRRFNANWCRRVVDVTLDRLTLIGATDDDALAERIAPWWTEGEVATEARLAHEAALICGEGMLGVWPEENAERVPEIYSLDPRLVHVAYVANRPRVRAWAAKFWVVDDGTMRATVSFPDRIERWATRAQAANITTAEAFEPDPEQPTVPNPFGQVPIFHLRVHHRRALSDLGDIVPLQAALNKLLADMMVSAEFGAFKQRYVITDAETRGKLRNAAGEIWEFPAGSSVGELTATELQNFLGAIESLAAQIGAISSTPKHYMLEGTAAQASGEALIAQEAPLVAKVQDRIAAFTPTWRRALRFCAEIMGEDPALIAPQWAPTNTIQPVTEAEIVAKYRQAGVPLPAALRRAGWTEEEIATALEEAALEEAARRESLGMMMAAAQVDFDRGTQEIVTEEPANV